MDLFEIRAWHLGHYIDTHFHGNRTKFAEEVGKKAPYINGIFAKKNRRNIGQSVARELEEKLNIKRGAWDIAPTPEEMKQYQLPAATSFQSNATAIDNALPTYSSADELNKEEFVTIRQSCLKLSAGNGCVVCDVTDDKKSYVVPIEYFKSKGAKPENAKLWEVDGNSMHPTLEDKDLVMVDGGRKELLRDRIFAMIYDNELYIKSIVKNGDGSITLRSKNPEYQGDDLTLDAEQCTNLTVIGQVIDLVSRQFI